MKKFLAALPLLLALTLATAQKAGDKIQFSTVDLNGNTVTDEIFSKNKLTMVNIWGTFCPPCIKEMPDLAKLNEANKEKGVQVVGIVIDLTDERGKILSKSQKDAEEIIKATGASYTHLAPNLPMFQTFLRNIQAVPSTIFVDKDGKVTGQMYLGARSQKAWQQIIDELLIKQ